MATTTKTEIHIFMEEAKKKTHYKDAKDIIIS